MSLPSVQRPGSLITWMNDQSHPVVRVPLVSANDVLRHSQPSPPVNTTTNSSQDSEAKVSKKSCTTRQNTYKFILPTLGVRASRMP